MSEQQSSFTAEAATLFRALESTLPEEERVCFDGLAARFLGPPFESARLDAQSVADTMSTLVSTGMGPAFAEVVARTRYIDDFLGEQIDRGIGQLVVLGAGFDTRAYRFDRLQQVGSVVFEVDHPAVQAQKKTRVAAALGALPAHVVYVPLDLGHSDLGETLCANGYDTARRTAFIWEGVTMYLTPDAVEETLAFVVRKSAPGSTVVFNYVNRPAAAPRESVEEDAAQRVTAHWGETQVFGLDPEKVEGFLRERGFKAVRNVSPGTLTGLYPALARRGLAVASNLSLALAVT